MIKSNSPTESAGLLQIHTTKNPVQNTREGMQSPAPFSDPALYNDYYTYNYHIPAELNTTLQIDRKHPGHSLQRTGEELIFKTSQGNVLKPLYDLHHQRYVVYWDLIEK